MQQVPFVIIGPFQFYWTGLSFVTKIGHKTETFTIL